MNQLKIHEDGSVILNGMELERVISVDTKISGDSDPVVTLTLHLWVNDVQIDYSTAGSLTAVNLNEPECKHESYVTAQLEQAQQETCTT